MDLKIEMTSMIAVLAMFSCGSTPNMEELDWGQVVVNNDRFHGQLVEVVGELEKLQKGRKGDFSIAWNSPSFGTVKFSAANKHALNGILWFEMTGWQDVGSRWVKIIGRWHEPTKQMNGWYFEVTDLKGSTEKKPSYRVIDE